MDKTISIALVGVGIWSILAAASILLELAGMDLTRVF
jgi:hypothetical protein